MEIKVQLVKAREKMSVPPDLTSGITSVFSGAIARTEVEWHHLSQVSMRNR
jgi:hypothetical protein